MARWPPRPSGEWDARAPENIAPLVTWLASAESAAITGQVFLVGGGRIAIAQGWQRGPGVDHGARWDPAELGTVVPGLVAANATKRKAEQKELRWRSIGSPSRPGTS